MQRDKILLIVFAALVVSSGLVLYRGFSSAPLTVLEPTIDSNDVIAKNQVDAVKQKIVKAINKIDTGGPLDTLIESQQFKDLLSTAVASTTIGEYGRPNPFLPPQSTATTTGE